MLFHSPEFIFLFLPLTLIIYYLLINRFSRLIGLSWLCVASLFFYGYWNWRYLPLMIGSILFNYLISKFMFLAKNNNDQLTKKITLIIGITGDLLLLCYYKYVDFFISLSNQVMHTQYALMGVILPLGISFFTFTQIAYLIDCYRDKVDEYNFIKYALFVTYFPHLIAGPILHHKEMISQFNNKNVLHAQENFLAGVTMFTLGLCKKLFFADSLAGTADAMFNAAIAGNLNTINAWIGTLAYTLQIYFDFSGYSDMAIGLSILFGVRLPINFYSPYKAASIIEFWRRWHITLSRFLRDYLYIPLGGNRNGFFRRYLNLILTMLLGGFWHGAGWTFLIWGMLHGGFLVVNHGWRHFHSIIDFKLPTYLSHPVSVLLTFFCVMIAWVFFRSPDVKTALTILHCMAGSHIGAASEENLILSNRLLLALPLMVALLLPNSLQIISRYNIALANPVQIIANRWYQWRISPFSALMSGLLFAVALLGVFAISDSAQFLYFEF